MKQGLGYCINKIFKGHKMVGLDYFALAYPGGAHYFPENNESITRLIKRWQKGSWCKYEEESA